MFNRISLKIGLLFFIFILLLESLLFTILYINMANTRIEEVMDNLLARGNTHRDVLEDSYNEQTLEHVGMMEAASDFIVIITDRDGTVVANSDPVEKEMAEVMEHTNHRNTPEGGAVVEDRWKEKDYIATDSPITIGGQHEGHVFMFANTVHVKRVLDQISDQFAVVGLFTLGLTIITIFILSRFITLPLIQMKEATEQLSRGRNKVELQTGRRDELGELAGSITRLSDDLERIKKERNDFLSHISHELRTPLTYIKGYADILGRKDITEENRKKYIHIVREETEQLAALIKNLFDLAKMDQNNFTIQRQEVNLKRFADSIAELVEPVFSAKDITLRVICPEGVTAEIDPERFQQVLLNILDNAGKHTHAGDEVCLRVEQTGETVRISIADTGEGVPEEDLPHLFDRLYRVEKSRSRSAGGSGLGLSIAKEIVEAHGGTIEVDSKLGKGTEMMIKLEGGRECVSSSSD
ncbi:sensor histidine kinase [Virgibacillus sediminis]|uniref:histidine kinase n=1 Tax=Virgibacillus sediminis TaxID=202260 RepID=A0ABV7A231_9BACI